MKNIDEVLSGGLPREAMAVIAATTFGDKSKLCFDMETDQQPVMKMSSMVQELSEEDVLASKDLKKVITAIRNGAGKPTRGTFLSHEKRDSPRERGRYPHKGLGVRMAAAIAGMDEYKTKE